MFVWVTLGVVLLCKYLIFMFQFIFFLFDLCESISLSRCQFVCLSIGGKDGEIVQRFSSRPKRLCTNGKSFGQNHQSDADGTWHLCCDTRMLVVGLFLQHACRIVNTLFCLEYHYDHCDHCDHCDHYDHYDHYDYYDHYDHYDQF